MPFSALHRFRSERDDTGRLARLLRDVGGNTLVMMAIAMIPLSAIAGSAVDTARTYVVRVRLQQACDAGVLAGRRFLVDDDDDDDDRLNGQARAQARAFFNNNFRQGWMRTHSVSFTPRRTNDNQVAATAAATVPMSVMKMFAAEDVQLQVQCEARFDVADADIMFVLDTTGSMACSPTAPASCGGASVRYTRTDGTEGFASQEAADSKMRALRTAVVEFDQTMRENADPTTNLRYGFVTYSSSVNVGALIPREHMVNQWTYQSRRLTGGDQAVRVTDNTVMSGRNSSNCSGASGRFPASGWNSDSTAFSITNATWNGTQCLARRTDLVPIWRYEPVSHNVAGFVAGDAVRDPTRLDGRTSRWQGCIEERNTTPSANFDIDALPADLNPDLIPNSPDTRWRPLWPQVVWDRGRVDPIDSGQTDADVNNVNLGSDFRQSRGFAACGVPARRLARMTANEVNGYVNGNDFRPFGGTYHDVGMIWGVRMLSPNGVFGADTQAWPNRNPPRRHIVFMTDGNMAPNEGIYGQYGIESIDRRVTGNGDATVLTARHNARFTAVCRYARERLNMTVWVVAFGASTSLNNELRGCATTPNHAFATSTGTGLASVFRQIAQQVAMLRISR